MFGEIRTRISDFDKLDPRQCVSERVGRERLDMLEHAHQYRCQRRSEGERPWQPGLKLRVVNCVLALS